MPAEMGKVAKPVYVCACVCAWLGEWGVYPQVRTSSLYGFFNTKVTSHENT